MNSFVILDVGIVVTLAEGSTQMGFQWNLWIVDHVLFLDILNFRTQFLHLRQGDFPHNTNKYSDTSRLFRLQLNSHTVYLEVLIASDSTGWAFSPIKTDPLLDLDVSGKPRLLPVHLMGYRLEVPRTPLRLQTPVTNLDLHQYF